jgi:CRISPR-associated exonuclease Cas4
MGTETQATKWDDSELVMISALEHWAYCPRQCALIHIEQTFDENIYTLRGRTLHERADEPGGLLEDGVRVERGLPLWSKRLGLVGKGDVIEFHGSLPYPVEYKHGRKRQRTAAELQLCAQAMCLEEMLGVGVPGGAIFHHASRRRTEVLFTDGLRRAVEEAVAEVRRMLASRRLPPPVNDARCEHCSLQDSCMPEAVGSPLRQRVLREKLFCIENP